MRIGWAAVAIVAAGLPARAGEPEIVDCTLKGIPLHGTVKVVESFPDLKVQIVDSFPDLKVKAVESFADDCGEWRFVESHPDLKIQFVESFPDLKIQFVSSFPGVR